MPGLRVYVPFKWIAGITEENSCLRLFLKMSQTGV